MLFILAQMCHQPEFYLGVVGRQENMPFLRHKGFSYFSSPCVSYRNVLKIRIIGTQSACRCHSLVVRGMDPAGILIHKQRKRLNIGRQELLKTSVFQHFINNWMLACKPLQNFFVGDKLLGFGNPGIFIYFQPYEQDISQLFW